MRKIAICMIILSLLLISGCNKTETTGEIAKSPYIGGSNGIIAEFLDMGIYNEDSRINEIYEDESFPIEILLQNKGEYEVDEDDVTITLKGIYLGSFDGITSDGILSNEDTIEPVSDTNEDGGEETLDFTPGSDDAEYETDFSGSSIDLDIFAEVVYEYNTEATVKKVCFKEDLQDESICEVNEAKNVYSSGAPIHVTSASESTAGSDKIAVEMIVENVGGGDVAIPDEEFDKRFNKISFESSDDDKWECRANGKLNEGRFDSSGIMKIQCKTIEPMDEDTLYTEDLGITLEYKYRYLIQESIRIRKE